MLKLEKLQPFYGYHYRGRTFDCGSKIGYLQATVEFGLRHPETGEAFARYLKSR